ncbi:MAG: hypothetical protein IRZ01_01205 [Thermoflavifilum aggregans]|nr:hypothetical protein [Thermoflavifilum aggregans]
MKLNIQHFLKKILIVSTLSVSFLNVDAQTQSSNIFSYTLPAGFVKSRYDDKTEFYFKKNKKWVIIDLFDIRPSNGNAAEDARNDWNEIVAPNYVVKNDISTEFQEIDGWQLTAQSVTTSGILKFNVSLITFSCSYGHASILLVNNDFQNILDGPITDFISSLKVVSPQEALAYIKPSNNANVPFANTQLPGSQSQTSINQNNNDNNNASIDNIVSAVFANPYNPPFPTPGEQPVKASIMMDVGWFVEATNDYIQYTKPDIKVIEYFLTETPYPNKDAYWQNYLSRYFAAENYFTLNEGPSYFSFEFAWANALYKPNGQKYFIAWLVDYNVPAAFLAICQSEAVFRSNFPDNKMLGEMQRYNNFPVDIQQIQGEWIESNFAGAHMYEVNTGNYAGMSFASAASSFTFSGNKFRFFVQGATGMVGTAKAFQEEETGTFNVNGYNLVINITSRTDHMAKITTPKNESVEYYVAFMFAKNTKVLFMQNKRYTGMTYHLIKK